MFSLSIQLLWFNRICVMYGRRYKHPILSIGTSYCTREAKQQRHTHPASAQCLEYALNGGRINNVFRNHIWEGVSWWPRRCVYFQYRRKNWWWIQLDWTPSRNTRKINSRTNQKCNDNFVRRLRIFRVKFCIIPFDPFSQNNFPNNVRTKMYPLVEYSCTKVSGSS